MGNSKAVSMGPAIGDGQKIPDPLPGDGLLGIPSPLLDRSWHQVESSRPTMEDFGRDDWTYISEQKKTFYAENQADQVLTMLRSQEQVPSFGYQINNFRHCLQAATMAARDNLDEEQIVCTLFHDIGFLACPDNHGEAAAALLANYISEKNHWLLRHHQFFLDYHAVEHPFLKTCGREAFRGHPYFEYTADWVRRYDQNSIQSQYDTAPLEYFEPMVQRLFSRPSHGRILNNCK